MANVYTFKDASKTKGSSDALKTLGVYNLAANISSIIIGIAIGPLADKFKIWKLLQMSSLLITLSGLALMYDIYKGKGQDVTYLFFSGYVVS